MLRLIIMKLKFLYGLFLIFPIYSNSDLLLNKENEPSSALLHLLEILEIKHDGSLKNIVELTQKNWLRPAGKERWEIQEINVKNKQEVLFLIEKLGCINEIGVKNKNTYFDDIIILSSNTFIENRLRFAYFIKLLRQDIKFRNLIFLGGENKIKYKKEDLLKADNIINIKEEWFFDGNFPDTETELLKFIFNQAELPLDFLNNINVIFIDTPMQKNDDGSVRRPNTKDQIELWLKSVNVLKPRQCIFISNNPYIGYQNSVAKSYLPTEFYIETVGPAAFKDEKISVYLDTLARWLYQEEKKIF